MERFDIYIRRFGPGREPAAERVARAFGVPVERARELVASLPRVVKRGVPEEQLERYVEALGDIRAEYDLRPTPIAPTQVIAVGSASAAHVEARVDDGATLMLPLPRDEAAPPPRFAGTVLQAAPFSPPEPARWAEPTGSSFGTADTVRERAEVMIEGTGEAKGALPRSSASTWIEGRSSVPPPMRGPNDTLVESRPPGSMVDSSAPPPPPQPPPQQPLAPPPGPSSSPPSLALEQRAPDSRLMHVHAPTVSTFRTLPEATAPVVAPVVAPLVTQASSEASYGAGAWGQLPGSLEPVVRSRSKDWTHPEGSLPPPAYGLVSIAPAGASPASEPPPLALQSLAPGAPMQAMSEAWQPIEPVSAAELGPRRAPRASLPPAPEDEALGPALDLQLFGREEYASLAATQSADFERTSQRSSGRAQSISVVPPGVAPASLAPRTGPRPSARPPMARGAQPAAAAELPAWLRWTLRVGIGASLFVIVGALRQSRALDRDVERALAKWETRPSASASVDGDARAAAEAATSRPELGPVALDWLRPDTNQLANGDKDQVRALVQRFKNAGAVEVYVGTITDTGMIKVGGELLVAMPVDPLRRAAVAAVHETFLRATFGAFAPHSDPKADVLRVTL